MSELETSTRPATDTAGIAHHRECVAAVLARKTPPRMVYAPNYWQWFAHHQNHRCLPEEIDCSSNGHSPLAFNLPLMPGLTRHGSPAKFLILTQSVLPAVRLAETRKAPSARRS